LVKSFRNILLNCNIKTPDGIISWSILRKIFSFEQNKITKLCTKITPTHIFPHTFAKIRVYLAVQILSKTVAAAILTILKLGKFITLKEKNP
jgi:hypothetical protein